MRQYRCFVVALLVASTFHVATAAERTSYSVIAKNTMGNEKCGVDVRIQEPIGEPALRELAQQIRQEQCPRRPRVFIAFYLPEMEVGAGSWASGQFTPELSIDRPSAWMDKDLPGLLREISSKRNLIGVWTAYAGVGRVLLLERDGDRIMLRTRFEGGKENVAETQVESIGKVTRYRFVGNRFGEYLEVDARGSLWIYDREGLVSGPLPAAR